MNTPLETAHVEIAEDAPDAVTNNGVLDMSAQTLSNICVFLRGLQNMGAGLFSMLNGHPSQANALAMTAHATDVLAYVEGQLASLQVVSQMVQPQAAVSPMQAFEADPCVAYLATKTVH